MLNLCGRVLIMFNDIIWDFDGTLFDTYPAMAAAFKKALADEGCHADKESILNIIKISLGRAIDYYAQFITDKDIFVRRFRHYENSFGKEFFPPMPYAMEVCRDIKVSGRRNFIFTHREDTVFKLLNNYDMLDYFSEIVPLDQRFRRKPAPDGFLYIIQKHGLNNGQVLAVGDRELDILAAHNAGIKGCFLDDGIIKCSMDTDYKIYSLKDLYGIIGVNPI